MTRCYHPDVFFSDTVFPSLRGPEAGDMWRMLLARATDLEVTLDEASGNAEGGQAKWTAPLKANQVSTRSAARKTNPPTPGSRCTSNVDLRLAQAL